MGKAPELNENGDIQLNSIALTNKNCNEDVLPVHPQCTNGWTFANSNDELVTDDSAWFSCSGNAKGYIH